MLDRIARARAKAREHAWNLIEETPAGFPWLAVAGKTLTGWLVIDMDATLVTASSDKEGAAPTWKKGYGFHPLAAWCANTRECLHMLLRPGNAGSNTFTDHKEVLAAALRQVPARFRRKILVRVDGAGASHDLIGHLLSLSTPRKKVLFTCGWTIMDADEDAIRQLPAAAWKPGITQDGRAEQDKDVAEITGLTTRAGNWPDGLRWIARRVKPSRRHLRNLTGYEKKTGWKYSITCTNIPGDGISGVPGSHHAAVHRRPAPRARRRRDERRPHGQGHGTAEPPLQDLAGQRRLGDWPRTSRPTSRHGPASSACTTANSATRTRTPSATGSGTCPPGWPATPASEPSPSAPTGPGRMPSSPAGSGSAPCQHPPDQNEQPQRQEGGPPRRGRSRCAPGHTGRPAHHPHRGKTDTKPKNRLQHDQ